MNTLYLEAAIKNYLSEDPSTAIKGFYQILNIEQMASYKAMIERFATINGNYSDDIYLALLNSCSSQLNKLMRVIEKIASFRGINLD